MNSPRRVFLATPGLQGLRSRVVTMLMLMLYRPNNKRARGQRAETRTICAPPIILHAILELGVGKMPKRDCYDNEDAELGVRKALAN